MNNSFTNHYKGSFYDEMIRSTVTLSLSKSSPNYCIDGFVWPLIGRRKGIVKLNLHIGFNIQDYILPL
jgi:hypothetical protein